MLKRIISSIYLALAFRSYRRDNMASSRYYVDKHFGYSNRKNATARAFSGTLYLLDKDMEKARNEFKTAAQNVKDNDGADARYVSLYCDYYLCLINEEVDCDRMRRLALEVPASRNMKRWLQLADKPVDS